MSKKQCCKQLKPNFSVQLQPQMNNSKNKFIDVEKLESERKRMKEIKFETEIKRKDEIITKSIKKKEKARENKKKEKQQQQLLMREYLQQKRKLVEQQQQSLPNFESEPKIIARQLTSEPLIIEKDNSEEKIFEFDGQQINKRQCEELKLIDLEESSMDFCVNEEIDAFQQIIQCKEYEKVLEEFQKSNSTFNQLDAQYKRKDNRYQYKFILRIFQILMIYQMMKMSQLQKIFCINKL